MSGSLHRGDERSGSPAARSDADTHLNVNASAVVENPRDHNSSSLFDIFAKKRVPLQQQLQPLPDVSRRDFADYLSQLRIERRKAGISADDLLDYDDAIFDAPNLTSASDSADTALASVPPHDNATPDAFSAVPQQYFDPSFDLRRPGVFEGLLAASRSLDDVHDALTGQLDTVECHLLTAIRARSKQFFEALSQLQDLRDRVLDASITAAGLQKHIGRAKVENCVQPLAIIAMARRRSRRADVLDLLTVAREAMQAPTAVARLYHAGDLSGTLDVIQQARLIIGSKLARVSCMADVRRKLDHFEKVVSNDLVDKYTRAAVSIVTIGSASGIVDIASDSGFPHAAGSSGSSSSAGSALHYGAANALGGFGEADLEWELQSNLKPLLAGLLRVGRVAEALDAFQASLIHEMIEVLRSDAAEAVAAAESASVSPSLRQPGDYKADVTEAPERLQALSPSAFLDVISAMCRAATSILRRVGDVHDLLERTLDSHHLQHSGVTASQASAASTKARGAPAVSNQIHQDRDGVEMAVELQRIRALSSGQVAVAVDTAQRRLAALLCVRREQSARMRVADLRALWDTVAQFNASCSAVLTHAGAGPGTPTGASSSGFGHQMIPVPGSLLAGISSTRSGDEALYHAKSMLQYAHTRNVSALTAMLDSEAWKQADVPRQVQAIADAISAAVSAAPSAAVIQRAAAAAASDEQASLPAAIASLPPAKSLTAGGQSFVIVGTGVMLVKMLGDYSSIAEAIPDVAGDAIQCTVQLLRQFNNRATQLVLGAGAMQTAQLKRITAKHLAVTSQTLGAILALLPSLRAVLLMRLPPQQHVLLSDLANVSADILAHDNRIRAKFVAIVKDLVVKCLGDMRGLRWGDPEASLHLPSAPMAELTNGITTLYRILKSVFRSEQLADIYTRILVMLNAHLPGQVAALLSHLVMEAQQLHAAQSGYAVAVAQGGRFSREVAAKRLAVDLRQFLAELKSLADACARLDEDHHGYTAGSSNAVASLQLSSSVASILGPGNDALSAMSAWVASQYGSEDIIPPSNPAAAQSSVGSSDGSSHHHDNGASQAIDGTADAGAAPLIDESPALQASAADGGDIVHHLDLSPAAEVEDELRLLDQQVDGRHQEQAGSVEHVDDQAQQRIDDHGDRTSSSTGSQESAAAGEDSGREAEQQLNSDAGDALETTMTAEDAIAALDADMRAVDGIDAAAGADATLGLEQSANHSDASAFLDAASPLRLQLSPDVATGAAAAAVLSAEQAAFHVTLHSHESSLVGGSNSADDAADGLQQAHDTTVHAGSGVHSEEHASLESTPAVADVAVTAASEESSQGSGEAASGDAATET